MEPTGPAIAYYESNPDGEGVLVHASVPVAGSPEGVTVTELPGIEQAATIVHHGDMDDVMTTLQTLSTWMDSNGYRSAGYNRELYVDAEGPRSTWVTELQEPVVGPAR